MDRHVPHRCALAFICAAMPFSADAQTVVQSAISDFDLGNVSGKPLRSSARSTRNPNDAGIGDDAVKPDKTKLRLTYQLDDEGPRFEIGTLGSRKGAMKSRLLHVAMDWNF